MDPLLNNAKKSIILINKHFYATAQLVAHCWLIAGSLPRDSQLPLGRKNGSKLG
jgi:hypothetical protein